MPLVPLVAGPCPLVAIVSDGGGGGVVIVAGFDQEGTIESIIRNTRRSRRPLMYKDCPSRAPSKLENSAIVVGKAADRRSRNVLSAAVGVKEARGLAYLDSFVIDCLCRTRVWLHVGRT